MSERLPKPVSQAPAEPKPVSDQQPAEAPSSGNGQGFMEIPEQRPMTAIARQFGRDLLRDLDPISNNGQATPAGIKVDGWDRTEALRRSDQPSYQFRRRLGAALLTLATIAGGFLIKDQPDDWQLGRTYSVDDRQPADDEICTTRGVGQRALLVVASEFTDDLSARRAAASRIRQAIGDSPDQRFAVCYDPETELTRVLTTEAVADLPDDRRVNWSQFPGRNDSAANRTANLSARGN